MSKIAFEGRAAERLEAVYLGADVTAQRTDTVRRLALRPGEHVLDIGSGPGFLCQLLAGQVGLTGRVRGVDVSAEMVARATARTEEAWVSYAEGDAMALEEPDAAYDVVVSTQVAEYLPDPDRFCAEVHRVMKPGGRGLIIATDWEGIIWYSESPERMQRMLRSFDGHCADPCLPRHLGPRLRAVGLAVDRISAYPLVNTSMYDGAYSAGVSGFIAAFARKTGAVPESEIADWQDELTRLDAEGRYFFASNRFVFEVSRPDG